MKKELIKVTSGYERFVHWLLAISCLLLCFTGMGMMYKSLNFFGVITALHLFWRLSCGGEKPVYLSFRKIGNG